MNKTILIVGAGSAIAKALAALLCRQNYSLILAGRNLEDLNSIAADLRVRYQAEILVEPFDALDFTSHPAFWDRCRTGGRGNLEGVIVCYGYLPDQSKAQADVDEAIRTINVNFTSAVSILELAARDFEQRRSGFLVGVSSVAGDRGRQSNYLYGCAKGGLSTYLQGLRNRLYHAGVHVLTVKPGFVDTPMTRGRIDPRSPLVASPERVARAIARGIRRRANVVYTPWFWRIIMAIVGRIPEWLFKRMRL